MKAIEKTTIDRIVDLHIQIESALKKSLDQAIELGGLLAEVKQDLPHGQFTTWIKENLPFTDRTARRYMKVHENRDRLATASGIAEAYKALEDPKTDTVSVLVEFDEVNGSLVACNARVSRPHISNNSGNNEWYTPPEIIEAARSVLERIDLDPASSDHAQQVVKAAQYYTIETDGLSKEWAGRVWMNPPYGAGEIEPFCEKLTRHYLQGDIQEAIVLVNNATETRWFQDMAQHAEAICFPRGRIRYYGIAGAANSPLQGQVFLYFGGRASRFFAYFASIGLCL